MKFYDVEQGSARWYQLRLGRPTTSNFHRIVTAKGEPSKQALAYMYLEKEPLRRFRRRELLTRDEAQRLAAIFAKLPDLLAERRS